MSVNRIYEWSRLQPQKTAIVYNDFALDYLTFALTIEAARKFFEQQKLPVGRMAIVVVDNLVSAWVLIIALRAIGLNTISVKSVSEAQDLGIRDVACLVALVIDRDGNF